MAFTFDEPLVIPGLSHAVPRDARLPSLSHPSLWMDQYSVVELNAGCEKWDHGDGSDRRRPREARRRSR
jgi:hypothetical protein